MGIWGSRKTSSHMVLVISQFFVSYFSGMFVALVSILRFLGHFTLALKQCSLELFPFVLFDVSIVKT